MVKILVKGPLGAGAVFDYPPGVYDVDLTVLATLESLIYAGEISFMQPTKDLQALELETNKKIFDLYMMQVNLFDSVLVSEIDGTILTSEIDGNILWG